MCRALSEGMETFISVGDEKPLLKAAKQPAEAGKNKAGAETDCKSLYQRLGIIGLDGIWWADVSAEFFAFVLSMIFLVTQRKKYHYWGS